MAPMRNIFGSSSEFLGILIFLSLKSILQILKSILFFNPSILPSPRSKPRSGTATPHARLASRDRSHSASPRDSTATASPSLARVAPIVAVLASSLLITKPLLHIYHNSGFDPAAYFSVEETPIIPSRISQSPKEIFTSNPYLALTLLFICLKAFIYIFPIIISRIKTFLFTYPLHVNVEIFGEWNHNLLERVQHVIDLKNNCLGIKARNFQLLATNARVWASSLASVALGESS